MIQGSHILQQVSSLSQAKGHEAAIKAALDKAPFTTLCFRTPWNATGWESIHEYGATLASSLGIDYAPRTMAGRYTPTAVLDSGPSYIWSGVDMNGNPQGPYRLPLPCNPDGTSNKGFEEAFLQMATVQEQYATEINHLLAYGRLWAEVDFGQQPGDVCKLPDGTTRPGNSLAQVVASHVRLYDLARAEFPGKILEFPLSGHGPAGNYIEAVTNKAVANRDLLVYFQMNGWQDQGVMWTPNMTGIQPPPGWCSKPVNRAFQAYDTKPTHDWDGACFPRVQEAIDAYTGTEKLLPTYVELYLVTSLTQAPADLISSVQAFHKPVVTSDPLAEALAKIAELEAVVGRLDLTIEALHGELQEALDDLVDADFKLEQIHQISAP